jgi:hypothetical protein
LLTPVGVPNTKSPAQVRRFSEAVLIFEQANRVVSGVTKDSSGAALAGCTVRLFNTATNVLEQTAVSDASGNFSFVVDPTQAYYVVSYKAGVPDVTGATVNTLVGA